MLEKEKMNPLLKLLGAKNRMEIRRGKLWEVTRVCGMDLFEVEREPAKPEPFTAPRSGQIEGVRIHEIKQHDDVSNLTRKPDLL